MAVPYRSDASQRIDMELIERIGHLYSLRVYERMGDCPARRLAGGVALSGALASHKARAPRRTD